MLTDLAHAFKVSPTTTEFAHNAHLEHSGAQPPANAYSCVAKTLSIQQLPMPVSAFQDMDWFQVNANNALLISSSATDSAWLVLSTPTITATLRPVIAHQVTTPTNTVSALKNAEPMKSTTHPLSPAPVFRVWEESTESALSVPLELNPLLMDQPAQPADPTNNWLTEFVSANLDSPWTQLKSALPAQVSPTDSSSTVSAQLAPKLWSMTAWADANALPGKFCKELCVPANAEVTRFWTPTETASPVEPTKWFPTDNAFASLDTLSAAVESANWPVPATSSFSREDVQFAH